LSMIFLALALPFDIPPNFQVFQCHLPSVFSSEQPPGSKSRHCQQVFING
jgi:hypothetical protein